MNYIKTLQAENEALKETIEAGLNPWGFEPRFETREELDSMYTGEMEN